MYLPLLCFWLAVTAKAHAAAAPPAAASTLPPGVHRIGRIEEPALREVSGVAASQRYTNVFWTHTDGKKRPVLFAIDRSGRTLARFPVMAKMEDWEDIALDQEGHLFLGDIGNNDLLRKELRVFRIDEPNPSSSGTRLRVSRTWRLQFPKKPFDCESLFIFENNGYVISKVFDDKAAALYRFSLQEPSGPAVLKWICNLPVSAPITGATISDDGKKMALVSHNAAFLFEINADLSNAAHLKPFHLKLGDQHIEGCTFVPDGLLMTSELRDVFLISRAPFGPGR